jgi:hypothetical protein
LGIGTETPQGAVHIATATGTPAVVLSDVGAPNTLPTLQFRRGPLSAYSLQVDFPSNNKARLQIGDAVTGYELTGGNVGLTGGRSIEFGGVTGQTATGIIGSVQTDNNNGQLLFSTRGSGTTAERARITNTGNLLINTTTDAGFRLDVNGTARVQGNVEIGGASATTVYSTYNSTTRNQIRYTNGSSFEFQEGGNERMRIAGGGNVGIGTNSPLVSLDIRTSSNSAITPLAIAPNTATTLLVGNTGTNGVLALGQNNVGQTWLQGRSRLGDGSSQPILLNPLGGNILIGTTADAGFRLDVNGDARVTGTASFNVGVIIGVGASTAGMIPTGTSGQESLIIRSGLVPSSRGTDITLTNGQGDVAITAGSRTMVSITRGFNPTSGTGVYNFFSIDATINQTGGANGAVRGIYYNPTLTSVLGTHHAFHSTSGRIRFENLPTSATGLSSGDLWNDAGTLKIV